MIIIIIFILLFLCFSGFIVLEEETLIILASLFWVDAAFNLIKDVLYTQLHKKGDDIKSDYLFFLSLQKMLITSLLVLHEKRVKIVKNYIITLRNNVLCVVLYYHLFTYFCSKLIVKSSIQKEDILTAGKLVIKNKTLSEVENIIE